jgi:hypothetical protein
MFWHTSIAPRRLMPRGEVATTCAGRPGLLIGNEYHHGLGRWRS